MIESEEVEEFRGRLRYWGQGAVRTLFVFGLCVGLYVLVVVPVWVFDGGTVAAELWLVVIFLAVPALLSAPVLFAVRRRVLLATLHDDGTLVLRRFGHTVRTNANAVRAVTRRGSEDDSWLEFDLGSDTVLLDAGRQYDLVPDLMDFNGSIVLNGVSVPTRITTGIEVDVRSRFGLFAYFSRFMDAEVCCEIDGQRAVLSGPDAAVAVEAGTHTVRVFVSTRGRERWAASAQVDVPEDAVRVVSYRLPFATFLHGSLTVEDIP